MDSTLPITHAGMTPRQRFVSTALGVLAGIVASVGTLAVTSAGFALSFDAIRAVGAAAHLRPSLTWLLPVCVDGAMAVSAVCAVVLKRMDKSNAYPWSVVVVGASISIAANALHAYQRGGDVPLPVEWAMAASAVPALLLALSVHLLVILAEAVRQPTTAETDVVGDPHATYDATMAAVEDALTGSSASSPGVVPEPSVNSRPKTPRKASPKGSTRSNGRKPTTDDKVARLLKRSPDLSNTQIAAKLDVSQRTVERAKERLAKAASPNGSEPPQE